MTQPKLRDLVSEVAQCVTIFQDMVGSVCWASCFATVVVLLELCSNTNRLALRSLSTLPPSLSPGTDLFMLLWDL